MIFWLVMVVSAVGEEGAESKKALDETMAAITEVELFENLRLLAHERMRGRGTEDGGYEYPAFFLEREFREYGLAPLGDPKPAGRSYLASFSATAGLFRDEVHTIHSYNVLGLLGGEKKDEVIIIGAHYDHEGEKKNKIYFGADDNASGTAAVLEIAESFGELARRGVKPRRSIVFALWGAEELGLLGSEAFTHRPPAEIPISHIVAVINLDMVGRNATKPEGLGDTENILFVCGTPFDNYKYEKVCPELYELNNKANKDSGSYFCFIFTAEPFRASDQYSFYLARPVGSRIPVIFYTTGMHPDYHRPTDTYDKINYPKLARVARLVFRMLWGISELPEKPRCSESQ